jgi:Aspartyl protease/PDZ domain
MQVVARIPFEMNGNSIFLQLRVNGSKPLWFALDTGAYSSVINTTTARELGLRHGANGMSEGAGGRVESSRISQITFDIGPAQLRDLELNALSLTPIENSVGRRMDGILGSEFFRRFVVEIDYIKNEINLYEPAPFNYRGSGDVLPLSFYENHPYVRAKVLVPGHDTIEGEFVIDSGSNFPLILLPSFIGENNIRQSLPSKVSVFGRGVGGEILMPLSRADKLQLGRFTINRPVTALPQEGMFGRAGKAGNIGTAILRRFKVTFDYSRNRMILEPNEHFLEPYEHDMSGLQLVTESPAFSVVRIHRVSQNSPAAETGLKSGDEIVTIGGRPAGEFRLAALREMFRQPDKQYALQIKRGSDVTTVALKTRRMI